MWEGRKMGTAGHQIIIIITFVIFIIIVTTIYKDTVMCFPQKIPRPWWFVTRVIAMSTGGFSTATHRDDLHKLAQQAKSFLQCPPLFGSQHCVKLPSRCGDTFDESAWVWFHQSRRRPFIFSKHLWDIFIKVILSKNCNGWNFHVFSWARNIAGKLLLHTLLPPSRSSLVLWMDHSY